MKTLCTLVFACFSFQALACDLDALNASFPIGYVAEQAATTKSTIPGGEPLIYSMYDFVGMEFAWDPETTASIPALESIQLGGYDAYRTIASAPFAY